MKWSINDPTITNENKWWWFKKFDFLRWLEFDVVLEGKVTITDIVFQPSNMKRGSGSWEFMIMVLEMQNGRKIKDVLNDGTIIYYEAGEPIKVSFPPV